MSSGHTAQGSTQPGIRLSGRAIGGLVVAAVLVVWIVFNRQTVDVSLVFGTVSMPLWVALAVAAVLGMVVGFAAGRRRYRRR